MASSSNFRAASTYGDEAAFTNGGRQGDSEGRGRGLFRARVDDEEGEPGQHREDADAEAVEEVEDSRGSGRNDNSNSNSNTNSNSNSSPEDDEDEDEDAIARETLVNTYHNTTDLTNSAPVSQTPSVRRGPSNHPSEASLHTRIPSHRQLAIPTETSSLLASSNDPFPSYKSISASTSPVMPRRPRLDGRHSYMGTPRGPRSRRGSFHGRLTEALGLQANPVDGPSGVDPNDHASPAAAAASAAAASRSRLLFDDRVWYDQFTSTDWVRDSIADAFRVKELRTRRDWRGRLIALLDGGQGWVLVLIIGVLTAGFAYVIDITESALFDYKDGFCTDAWWYNRSRCCDGASICEAWLSWADAIIGRPASINNVWVDFGAFFLWVVLLSTLACLITLQTKTTISSAISLSTLDENLAADHHSKATTEGWSAAQRFEAAARRPPVVYYPAAGSGVAEVKVILSGFVLHGYLGVRTLACKMIALILSVASGLSIGKEGPYVHIAVCIGNVVSRLFPKYRDNDGKRREVLAASAAAGVAVAFGAPIGGVLFSLEEVSYYFPDKTLFRTFFCSIAAALCLRFFNPYGTGKIVLFEVRYLTEWRAFELILFIIVGIIGGLAGALFIKASRVWAKQFRSIALIKKYPLVEVLVVAFVTGLLSFWNRYVRLPVAELLFEIASPCDAFTDSGVGLCPTHEMIPTVILSLCVAFLMKFFLTMVTFGIKVPAGIYVPSMVFGGFLGRIVGHLVQLLTLSSPSFSNFVGCPTDPNGNPESCVVPGIYALVAAGATMCGVTRLTVTLAVILFELTGSLEHVLPFSIGILAAKWTAQAIEPLSIYDLLTDMNAYPYLDSKVRPVFTTELGDITMPLDAQHVVDTTLSPLVPAPLLRSKLDFLHMAGELDGGLPILRDGTLVGLIPAPDLEFALDRLENEKSALCLMSPQHKWLGPSLSPVEAQHKTSTSWNINSTFDDHRDDDDNGDDDEAQPLFGGGKNTKAKLDPADLTPYVDPAPVSLDIYSSMDLVFECFVKLGLRYICVLHDGKFAGLVHKKEFVRYVKDILEGKEK